jgi:hypothetical protein
LNTAFYQTAFDAEEQAKILAATVVNDDNPVWATKGGNTTEDKVFLLSFNEVMTRAYGFSSNYYAYDSRRMAQGTDYAITRGLWVCENDEHAGTATGGCGRPAAVKTTRARSGMTDMCAVPSTRTTRA